MDKKYFGLKKYLVCENPVGEHTIQKYTFPNGISAVVRSFKANENYPKDFWTIDILVGSFFAYNTGITNETLRFIYPKKVKDTLLRIKGLSFL